MAKSRNGFRYFNMLALQILQQLRFLKVEVGVVIVQILLAVIIVKDYGNDVTSDDYYDPSISMMSLTIIAKILPAKVVKAKYSAIKQ